ncbi:hypothetical protein Y032_0148g2634 [Ancylostoma ceylanicum]|nr:hypothetical protein Y032_0148g2634 [Ancylostoma ceylanicum]
MSNVTVFWIAGLPAKTHSAFHQGRCLGRQQGEKECRKVCSNWRGVREKQVIRTDTQLLSRLERIIHKPQYCESQNCNYFHIWQSYSQYNMGWKIHIVNELPTTITDVKEEPYVYEQWLQTQNVQEPHTSSTARLYGVVLSLLCAVWLF